MMSSSDLTIQDILSLESTLFEWADSYDTKDWGRLRECLAPYLRVDYRSFLDKIWEAMPAGEFVDLVSSPAVLGDHSLKTQHFIGASKWIRTADDEVVGYHQLRVPHQKKISSAMDAAANASSKTKDMSNTSDDKNVLKGHAHSTNTHWYKKIDGIWKFAGLSPDIRWFEHDFDKVFESGRREIIATEKDQ